MAKKQAKASQRNAESHSGATTSANQPNWLAIAAIVIMLGAAGYLFYRTFAGNASKSPNAAANAPAASAIPAAPATPTTTAGTTTPPGELNQMTIAQAVMVTVELDFGGRIPSIAEALTQIERVYQPDDGAGRTFAILDAYGEPTPDGKLLHMSMHVSSEKSGLGMLKFKRNNALLWQARIGKPGDAPAGAKNLMIYVANGTGGNHVLDGQRSGQVASVLDVLLQNSQQRLRDVWPDGSEREFTFVYSACGCPVKANVRRTGDRTQRTSDSPVMFPDDPAALTTIANLMKW